MAEQFHVNGPCKIQCLAALSVLGHTVDGVDVSIEDHDEPITSDARGPSSPMDFSYFPQTAIIRATMVFYDESILASLRTRSDNTTEGQIGTPGSLYGADSIFYRLLLTSPKASRPYNFPTVKLTGSRSGKLGTRRTTWDMTWTAIAYLASSGDPDGTVLYNTTTS